MRRNKIALLCLTASLITTSAYCAEGPYMSGNIGYADVSNSIVEIKSAPLVPSNKIDFDSGYLLSGSFGYNFGAARIEGEVGYQNSNFGNLQNNAIGFDVSGEASALSFMVNGYYDFFNHSYFSFFLTGGLGIAQVDFSDIVLPPYTDVVVRIDGDDNVFAYQIGAGVGYSMTEQLMLDFKYRYFVTEDPDLGIAKTEFESHNLLVGIRYQF